ncbi:hypothetical protein VNO77_24316 [Canavalia gladiata]|uniref:Uncharacterized protein n=1 Tax=Canavalia gladiata TaxID=3824 RepID=A0AAN9L621_CANGL
MTAGKLILLLDTYSCSLTPQLGRRLGVVEFSGKSFSENGSGHALANILRIFLEKSMEENLQMVHQELSVIIDLINTVEAIDAVMVPSLTRLKLLMNKALSNLAVSAAIKLQRFRSLSVSTVHVNHDAAGMLAINMSPNLCHSLQFGRFVLSLLLLLAFCVYSVQLSYFEHFTVGGLVLRYLCFLVFDLLSLAQGTSVYLSLVFSGQYPHTVEGELTNNVENAILPLESSDIFHEHIFGKGSENPNSSGNRLSGTQAKDGSGLLGHSFYVFGSQDLVQYSSCRAGKCDMPANFNPTWHSRVSSLIMEVPPSTLCGCQNSKRQFLDYGDGIKANRDILCLSFELEQGETLSLVPNVDPGDSEVMVVANEVISMFFLRLSSGRSEISLATVV